MFKNLTSNGEYTWFNNKMPAGVDGRCNVGFSFPQLCVASKAPLTKANYEAAVTLLGTMKKVDGSPVGIRPTTIAVGYGNRAAVKGLFESMLVAGGDSNIYYKDVEVVVSPYIS
ncbi:Mu-like prophage major head subunit gpT family protein [Marinomonas epiphytica]